MREPYLRTLAFKRVCVPLGAPAPVRTIFLRPSLQTRLRTSKRVYKYLTHLRAYRRCCMRLTHPMLHLHVTTLCTLFALQNKSTPLNAKRCQYITRVLNRVICKSTRKQIVDNNLEKRFQTNTKTFCLPRESCVKYQDEQPNFRT